MTAYGLGVTSVLGQNIADETYLALLSDTHVAEDMENNYRGFYPYKNLQQVASQVMKANPDAVLINGDVARLTGEKGDYGQIKNLLSPIADRKPIYMTLGNHDHRENIQEVFTNPKENQAVKDKRVAVIEQSSTRFVLLDSLMFVNKTPGYLGQGQRRWLGEFLEKSDTKPTVLFLHHPPFESDSALLDFDQLFSIIKPHQKVKAVFYGHSHQYRYDTVDGIHLINQPAIGYNFADTEPVGWISGKFRKEGVSLTLHALAGNTRDNGKTTSLQWR